MKKLLMGLLFTLALTGCGSTHFTATNSITPTSTAASTGTDANTGASYAKSGLLMRATMEDRTDFTDTTYFIDYQLVSGYTVAAVTVVYWECSQGLFSASWKVYEDHTNASLSYDGATLTIDYGGSNGWAQHHLIGAINGDGSWSIADADASTIQDYTFVTAIEAPQAVVNRAPQGECTTS